MSKKENDELVDTIQFGHAFGLIDSAANMKEKYRAFAGWRAIMEGRGKTGHLAFLPNRNCGYGTNGDLRKIEAYLKKVVKKLEKWAFEVGPASQQECLFGEHFWTYGIEGRASPRASHGYLYIQIGILKRAME